MSTIYFLLICYNFIGLSLAQDDYDAPKSVEYPFGDEAFNADIKEERVQEESRELHTELVRDIYTFCPNKTEDENELEGEIPYNDQKCTKCDVRPTMDKLGALVECYNCTDNSFMMTAAPDEDPHEHILFLTTYLEIANYSAPEDMY